jgi:RNA polymerase sigma-70 factor, ECF subfamily
LIRIFVLRLVGSGQQSEDCSLDLTNIEDEILMRLIARGLPEALSELYDRYARLVYSLALSTVGDAHSAEEIVQDVFFRVWEKADTYRAEQSKVSTWISSIARNRAIDVLRKRQVRPEGRSIAWNDLTLETIAQKDGYDPEEQVEQSLEARRVRAALARLPVEQQRALALAYFLGYTQSQIAEELREPLGTVKTRIRAAMQKLRELLVDEQISS